MRRDFLVFAAVVGAGIAARLAYAHWIASRPARLDVYFDDGSFVTYVEGSSEAEQLLPLARAVLEVVRG